jgi:hypothetical protein
MRTRKRTFLCGACTTSDGFQLPSPGGRMEGEVEEAEPVARVPMYP